PAGTARLPRTARSVNPDIDALYEALGQQHVVVNEEDRVLSNVVTAQEKDPFADHVLAGLIRGMRLARDHELNRIFLIGENPRQPLAIVQQQIRAFVGGEAPRKAERQSVGIEDVPGLFNIRRAISGPLAL